MNLYLTNAWVALPGHDSYGHDVEAAYLMLEAEEVLGGGHAPRDRWPWRACWSITRWPTAGTRTRGGFYRDGATYGPPEDKQKEWWVQAEGLNALLLMHDLLRRHHRRLLPAFQKQWQFIIDYQRDADVSRPSRDDRRRRAPGPGRQGAHLERGRITRGARC